MLNALSNTPVSSSGFIGLKHSNPSSKVPSNFITSSSLSSSSTDGLAVRTKELLSVLNECKSNTIPAPSSPAATSFPVPSALIRNNKYGTVLLSNNVSQSPVMSLGDGFFTIVSVFGQPTKIVEIINKPIFLIIIYL